MDPQQELFSALLLELKKQYPDGVYDTFLPPEGTPYPFIYLADSDLNYLENCKSDNPRLARQSAAARHSFTDASADQAGLQTSGTYRQLFLVRAELKSENIAGHNHQPATSSRYRGSDFFI